MNETRTESKTQLDARNVSGDEQTDELAGEQTSEFLVLFAKHQQTIQLYLSSLLPTQNDVDDVFQETSLTLWREFHCFRAGTNFGAWACTVAFNRVRAWRSKRSRENLVFSDAFLQAVSDELIENSTHFEERAEALKRCVKSLPDHHRELVQHRYDSGASVEDIAAQANRSPVAVYRMLSRVRHALHECVSLRLQNQP